MGAWERLRELMEFLSSESFHMEYSEFPKNLPLDGNQGIAGTEITELQRLEKATPSHVPIPQPQEWEFQHRIPGEYSQKSHLNSSECHNPKDLSLWEWEFLLWNPSGSLQSLFSPRSSPRDAPDFSHVHYFSQIHHFHLRSGIKFQNSRRIPKFLPPHRSCPARTHPGRANPAALPRGNHLPRLSSSQEPPWPGKTGKKAKLTEIPTQNSGNFLS